VAVGRAARCSGYELTVKTFKGGSTVAKKKAAKKAKKKSSKKK
jgi:hypothetical protein